MASEPAYLLDTNILLRLSKRTDSNHALVKDALDALTARGVDICCTPAERKRALERLYSSERAQWVWSVDY